jgi:hypothetical protein
MTTIAGGQLHSTQTTPDFVEPTRDLATNLVRGWGFQTVFGRRVGIAVNTTADVWSGPTATRPLVVSGTKTMYVKSDSVSDTLATLSGARLVGVTYIDGNGDWRQSDLLPLNGTSNVMITTKPSTPLVTETQSFTLPDGTSVPAQIFRIQDVQVFVAAGATELSPRVVNVGNLTIVDGAGTVFEHVPAGAGRSRAACFHVPRLFTGRLTFVPVGSPGGQGTFFVGTTFGSGTAWALLPLAAVNSGNALFRNDAACTPIVSRSDVQVVVSIASNNSDATAILQVRLEPAPVAA